MDGEDYDAVIAGDERLTQALDEDEEEGSAWTAEHVKATKALIIFRIPKLLATELVKEAKGTTAMELAYDALTTHQAHRSEE